jgi:hypothetical protein
MFTLILLGAVGYLYVRVVSLEARCADLEKKTRG